MNTKMIYIDGLGIELTRKPIKRIYLRVKAPDGRVTVSAPYAVPDRQIIDFVRRKRSWIDNTAARIRARADAGTEPESSADKESRRRELKERIAGRLPEIERRTGLRCSGWTVRDMHTRWGSCNTQTHHINFSLMLWSRTDAELDYIILHELVHTVVPGHGPDFYALMDRFMPGWKAIRKGMRS